MEKSPVCYVFKSFVHMIKISEHSTITFLHSSLHLCEACKHGFTHSILVGVRWWEFIWASFNAQTGAFGPQWSLLGKAKTIIRDDILDTGAPQAAVLIAMWAEISTLARRFHLLRGSGQQTRGSSEDKKKSAHRDGNGDALLVTSQTFAFLPAHRLQHLAPDIITC